LSEEQSRSSGRQWTPSTDATPTLCLNRKRETAPAKGRLLHTAQMSVHLDSCRFGVLHRLLNLRPQLGRVLIRATYTALESPPVGVAVLRFVSMLSSYPDLHVPYLRARDLRELTGDLESARSRLQQGDPKDARLRAAIERTFRRAGLLQRGSAGWSRSFEVVVLAGREAVPQGQPEVLSVFTQRSGTVSRERPPKKVAPPTPAARRLRGLRPVPGSSQYGSPCRHARSRA
jgi:hypothetical protein